MNNLFSERLVKLRTSIKISQQKLAEGLGINQSQVNKLEHGYIEANFNLLINIAKFFNVTTDYLLGCEKLNVVTKTEIYSPEQQKLVKTILNLSDVNFNKVVDYVSMLEILEHSPNNK